MPAITRVTVRMLEDQLLSGIQNILVKQEDNYLYTAFTVLATNVATSLASMSANIDKIDDNLRTELGDRAESAAEVKVNDRLKNLNTLIESKVVSVNVIENMVDEKVGSALDGNIDKVVNDKVVSVLDGNIDNLVKEKVESGLNEIAMTGKKVTGDEEGITKHVVEATIRKELQKTRDSVILCADKGADLTEAGIKDIILKQMNISRLDLTDCNDGKEFGKKAMKLEPVSAPKKGRNSEKRFFRLTVKGRGSKRAVFDAFKILGKTSLAKISCANDIPDFLKDDFKKSEFLAHLLRKKVNQIKTRSGVDAKNKAIVLSVAKRDEKNAKFVPLAASRAIGEIKFQLEDFGEVENEEDPVIAPLLAICQELVDHE